MLYNSNIVKILAFDPERRVIFKFISWIHILSIVFEITQMWISLIPHWWLVNIGSGNALKLWGDQPLPKPMLMSFIWRHTAPLCHKDKYMFACMFTTPNIFKTLLKSIQFISNFHFETTKDMKNRNICVMILKTYTTMIKAEASLITKIQTHLRRTIMRPHRTCLYQYAVSIHFVT